MRTYLRTSLHHCPPKRQSFLPSPIEASGEPGRPSGESYPEEYGISRAVQYVVRMNRPLNDLALNLG